MPRRAQIGQEAGARTGKKQENHDRKQHIAPSNV